MVLNIGNVRDGSFLHPQNTMLHRQKNRILGFFEKPDVADTFSGGAVYGKGNAAVSGLYTANGRRVETETKGLSRQLADQTPVQRALARMYKGAYMDWENTALYNKMGLVSRLFGNRKDVSKFPGSDFYGRRDSPASGLNPEKNMPVRKKMEKQPEQWAVKASAEEVLEQMGKGSYLYDVRGDNFYVQGQKENGRPDVKKRCSMQELRKTLGYDDPKTVSAKDHAVTFEKNSIYKFTGSDGKEHRIMSTGEKLEDNIFDAVDERWDKEAMDYARFWNDLAEGDEDGLAQRYSREEIRHKLSQVGIEDGPFTVTVGSRSQTYDFSHDEEQAYRIRNRYKYSVN